MQEHLRQLSAWGITFESGELLRQFSTLYQHFNNATRLPCNRGYTPLELVLMHTPKERRPMSITLGPNMRKMLAEGTMDEMKCAGTSWGADIPDDALRYSMPKELSAKTGRNDPCPCDSGKKYKHCC